MNKKTFCLLLSLLITLSGSSNILIAAADESPCADEMHSLIAAAAEPSVFSSTQEKTEADDANVLRHGLNKMISDNASAANLIEKDLDREIAEAAMNYNEERLASYTTGTDAETLYQNFNAMDVPHNQESILSADDTSVELQAISYYSGTTIPTYTSVTGRSLLLEDYTDDQEYTVYHYTYNPDDYLEYIDYLMDYYGWIFLDSYTAANRSYYTIYLGKGGDVISITAHFALSRTLIMIKTPPREILPTGITLNRSSKTLYTNTKLTTLTATVSPSNATDASVTWSSSRPSVATVDSKGVVSAKSVGSTTITAKTTNGKTASCTITVKALQLAYYSDTTIPTYTSVTGRSLLSQDYSDDGKSVYYNYSFNIDDYFTYAYYLLDHCGWSYYDGATEDSNSFLSLAKNEELLMLAANTTLNIATVMFSAPPVSPSGITLNTSSKTLYVGNQFSLTATVSPSNATDKSVTWSSSAPSVASVTSDGVVTAKAIGSATITAKTVNGKTASCIITVSPIAVTGITLNKSNLTLTNGNTASLSATISPSNATEQNVTWSSSNSKVASVTSDGVVTAKAIGSATITATTSNGKTATCIITVVPSVGTTVSISADKKSFEIHAYNIPQNKTVLLALYNHKNMLVDLVSAKYRGQTLFFTTDQAYSKGKIMVLDDLNSITPYCDCTTLQ